MSCLSAMSPPAIWPPHSSEQIFEAGIRTCCHAYLNDQASGSHQRSPWGWLRHGLGGRTRVGPEHRPLHLGRQLQPYIRSSLGDLRESKPELGKKKKKAKGEVFAVPCAAVQTTPNTQPLNKQGDSISEVELNSFKQFSGKKRGSKLKPFRDYSEGFIYCVFSIKDIWKSESHTHYSWPVLKFKNDGGGGCKRYCPFSAERCFHPFSP